MKRKAIILPVLLFLLGIGLISYSLWNLLQAHVGIQEKREEKEITVEALAAACVRAKDTAYKAVMKPKPDIIQD